MLGIPCSKLLSSWLVGTTQPGISGRMRVQVKAAEPWAPLTRFQLQLGSPHLPAEQQHPLAIYCSAWLLLSSIPLLPRMQIPFFPPAELTHILPFTILLPYYFLFSKFVLFSWLELRVSHLNCFRRGFWGRALWSEPGRFSLEYSEGGNFFSLLSTHLQIPERFC